MIPNAYKKSLFDWTGEELIALLVDADRRLKALPAVQRSLARALREGDQQHFSEAS